MSKTVNFGFIKEHITNFLGESYFTNSDMGKDMFKEYMKILKESKVLKLEFAVFKNLEHKYIKEEVSAIRYIDENIKLFKDIKREEIISENNKLSSFLKEFNTKEVKPLHEAIQNLILENCLSNKIPNVDLIHDSFDTILEHIKTKRVISEQQTEALPKNDDEFSTNLVIKKVNEVFNKKYSDKLNEDSVKVLKIVNGGTVEEKENLLNELKNKALASVEAVTDYEDVSVINEVKSKIQNTIYNEDTYLNDIIDLYELMD